MILLGGRAPRRPPGSANDCRCLATALDYYLIRILPNGTDHLLHLSEQEKTTLMFAVHSPNVLVCPSKSPSVQGIYFTFPEVKEEKYPLHQACREGHLHKVTQLLSGNAMVNSHDDDNNTPIHIACDHRHHHHISDILLCLLQNKANVNITDKFLETPLHKASYNGCLQCVKTLIHHRANVSQVSEIHETCLHAACRGRNYKVAKYLIKKGVHIDERNVFWRTALNHACEEGDLNTVKLLIRRGAKINTVDADKQCPILRACTKHHVEVVEFLLQKGATMPDIILHRYCADQDVSSLLFKYGANINCMDKDGHNILHNASREGNTELVKFVLDQINFTNLPFGQKLSGYVSSQARKHIRFFAEFDISVNMTDRQKRTALHLACEKGYLEVARLLIKANANVHATDRSWRSPLHLACEAGHTKTAILLLENGADSLLTDKYTMSPLHLACSLSSSLPCKTLDLQLVTSLVASGGYLFLNRGCDRTLLKHILKMKWPVNRKILYTLCNEKAIWPLPKPGRFVQVPLCKEDLLLSNILNVVNVDPVKLLMLYKFGYEIPGVYNQVMYIQINHPERFDQEEKWDLLMKQVSGILEGLWSPRELCRFTLRHQLGRQVTQKLDQLAIRASKPTTITSPNPFRSKSSKPPKESRTRKLPKRLKEYLVFSEFLSEDDLLADRVFLRNKSLKLKVN